MADPGQLWSRFLAGRTLSVGDVDVDADLIPLYAGTDGDKFTPAAFIAAVGASPEPDITAPTPSDTPDPTAPLVATTAEFTFPDQSNVTRTTWRLKDGSNTTIWESLRDTVHLFTITIPADTMEYATEYTLFVQFFGRGKLTTRRASVTFTTAEAP